MTPEEEKQAAEIKALVTRGQYIAAMAAQMEYLRGRAAGFLAQHHLQIVTNPDIAPPALAKEYAARASAVSEEISRRGEECPVELSAAQHIYEALGNVLKELAVPGPLDDERVARFILLGMDLGTMSFFCSRIDTLDDEAEVASLANARQIAAEKQRVAADRTNARRTGWYTDAFAIHAMYLHFNPGQDKRAIGAALNFAKEHQHAERSDNALKQALRRHKEEYESISRVVTNAASLGPDTAPAYLRDAIQFALAKFDPQQA